MTDFSIGSVLFLNVFFGEASYSSINAAIVSEILELLTDIR